MKTKLTILVVCWLCLPKILQAASCFHTDTTFQCVSYLKNYDGDTITFNISGIHPLFGQKINVRVAGIDTPEIYGQTDCEKKAAVKAKDIVTNLLKKANRIDLTAIERDKYFRIVADVVFDGLSISDILIQEKLAYPYDGGTKQTIDWCKSL